MSVFLYFGLSFSLYAVANFYYSTRVQVLVYILWTRNVFIDEERRPPMSLMHFYFMDDVDPPTEEMLEKAFEFRKSKLFAWCFR